MTKTKRITRKELDDARNQATEVILLSRQGWWPGLDFDLGEAKARAHWAVMAWIEQGCQE